MASRRLPSLNWLRVFEAAARLQSFAAAADELGMSAAAVSQQIRALETQLGAPLFERGPRSVSLTEKGRAYWPTVQQSLGAIQTTTAAVFGEDGRRTVRLRAMTILAMGWLPPQIAAFENARPDIRVDLETGDAPADFDLRGAASPADLQIDFGSPDDAGDNAMDLFGETISAVAAEPIAARLRSVEDLMRETLIDVTPHWRGWRQLLAALDVDLSAARLRAVATTPLALRLAKEGLGVALARAPASDGLADALGLRPVPLAGSALGRQRYRLRLRPGTRASGPAKALAAHLVACAASAAA